MRYYLRAIIDPTFVTKVTDNLTSGGFFFFRKFRQFLHFFYLSKFQTTTCVCQNLHVILFDFDMNFIQVLKFLAFC